MGKYYTTTVLPDMNHGAATGTATSDGDLLFDWTPFEIPKGAAALCSVSAQIFGTDGADGQGEDLMLYFAKSINGVAPISLGTTHDTPTVANTTQSRRNILDVKLLDWTLITDTGGLIGYNIITSERDGTLDAGKIILQGDPMYASTEGYQTLWIAGVTEKANGIWNFDTSIASAEDGSANVAANTTGASVVLKTSGTDPRNVFAPGDIAVGSTGGPTMEVVSVDTATQMTVKNISEQLDNGEIINPLNPITFHFGFEI